MSDFTVIALSAHGGSVVLFDAVTPESLPVTLAVDSRCAQDIVEALDAGEMPLVEAEDWQVVLRTFPR